VGRKIAHTGRPLSYSFSSLSLFCRGQNAVDCACGQRYHTTLLAVVVQAQQEQLLCIHRHPHGASIWHTCSAEAHTCIMLHDLVFKDDGQCECHTQMYQAAERSCWGVTQTRNRLTLIAGCSTPGRDGSSKLKVIVRYLYA